jgi:PAS domain S-box-containing protein
MPIILPPRRTHAHCTKVSLAPLSGARNPIFIFNMVLTPAHSNLHLQAAEITGFTSAEVMGCDLVQNFITEEYRPAVRKVLDSALKGIEKANFEFPLFTKAGERVDVLLNATTRRDAQGGIVGVVGVGQDITGLKRKEQEVSRIAADLRALIDTANAPIFGITPDGLVNEWNNKASACVVDTCVVCVWS